MNEALSIDNLTKKYKNKIALDDFSMMELQEADLNKFVAGAGETRNSGGVLCTSTAECYFGTLLKPCCPKK